MLAWNKLRLLSLPVANLTACLLTVLSTSNAAGNSGSWSLSKDFSVTENPQGAWSYLVTSYGSAAMRPLPPAKGLLGLSGLDGWSAGPGDGKVELLFRPVPVQRMSSMSAGQRRRKEPTPCMPLGVGSTRKPQF
jgi:hypothetical protein